MTALCSCLVVVLPQYVLKHYLIFKRMLNILKISICKKNKKIYIYLYKTSSFHSLFAFLPAIL